MADEGVAVNQEIELVLRDCNGNIKGHKKVIFKDSVKSEFDLEV